MKGVIVKLFPQEIERRIFFWLFFIFNFTILVFAISILLVVGANVRMLILAYAFISTFSSLFIFILERKSNTGNILPKDVVLSCLAFGPFVFFLFDLPSGNFIFISALFYVFLNSIFLTKLLFILLSLFAIQNKGYK